MSQCERWQTTTTNKKNKKRGFIIFNFSCVTRVRNVLQWQQYNSTDFHCCWLQQCSTLLFVAATTTVRLLSSFLLTSPVVVFKSIFFIVHLLFCLFFVWKLSPSWCILVRHNNVDLEDKRHVPKSADKVSMCVYV